MSWRIRLSQPREVDITTSRLTIRASLSLLSMIPIPCGCGGLVQLVAQFYFGDNGGGIDTFMLKFRLHHHQLHVYEEFSPSVRTPSFGKTAFPLLETNLGAALSSPFSFGMENPNLTSVSNCWSLGPFSTNVFRYQFDSESRRRPAAGCLARPRLCVLFGCDSRWCFRTAASRATPASIITKISLAGLFPPFPRVVRWRFPL